MATGKRHLLSDCLSPTPLIYFKGGGTSKENAIKQPEIKRGRGEDREGEIKSMDVDGRMGRGDLDRACKCWNPFLLSVALLLFSNLCYCAPVILEELQCGFLIFYVRICFSVFLRALKLHFILCRNPFPLKNVTLRCDNENTLMYKHKNGCKMLFHLLVCCLFFYADE